MPGVGKTTVGRQIADQLGWQFFDLDREIERRAGCSIPMLFAQEGEAVFRRRESDTLRTLIDIRSSVIATGGGAVLSAANRAMLRDRTCCVYLRAGPEFLWRRLRRDRSRPLLQVPDLQGRLRELSAEREPRYEETASVVVDSERSSRSELAKAVLKRLSLDFGEQ